MKLRTWVNCSFWLFKYIVFSLMNVLWTDTRISIVQIASLHTPIQYPKPDGLVSFDVPTSLYRFVQLFWLQKWILHCCLNIILQSCPQEICAFFLSMSWCLYRIPCLPYLNRPLILVLLLHTPFAFIYLTGLVDLTICYAYTHFQISTPLLYLRCLN